MKRQAEASHLREIEIQISTSIPANTWSGHCATGSVSRVSR